MRTKYLILPIMIGMLAFSGIASATFQSINECLIDKFCTDPKNHPSCQFKWNDQFRYCMKHYAFHGKDFNYDWDYIRTKEAMDDRIMQLKILLLQIHTIHATTPEDKKLHEKVIKSLENELEKRKKYKIIMKDPNKIP